jgi:predicted TIM-barrel fold metal-dependent hydrolase
MTAPQSQEPQKSHREGRVINDADSHITEMPGWLESYCTDYVRENLLTGPFPPDLPALQPYLAQANNRLEGKDPELTTKMKSDLFGTPEKLNGFASFGAVEKSERSESLDIAGISSQLVFPTFGLTRFTRTPNLDVVYGGAEALNRGMADFCADDPRLLAVGHVPLNDPKRAIATLKQALDVGVKTIWLRSDAMDGRAPSHRDYDPLWAMMEEAGMPISLHIGSGERMPEEYMNTGVARNLDPNVKNVESTKPHDIPVLHHSPERWLTCMIYHGVLDRFPKLKIGMIELGSNWVPAMMQNLDIGKFELGKFDADLKALKLKPSEYVSRQVRVTPLHMEDAGWVLRNVGKEILMFNTDYPHAEGGSDPFGDFERSLNAVNATEEELDHFYTKNYQDYLSL